MGCKTEKDLRSDGNSLDLLSDWFFMWHLIQLRAFFLSTVAASVTEASRPLVSVLIEGNDFIQSTQNNLLCLLFVLLC